MKAITLYLGKTHVPVVVRTELAQKGFFNEEFLAGYGVGGDLDGVMLRLMEVDGGYGVDGAATAYLTEWLSMDGGYSVGGDANIMMIAYSEPIDTGYGVGGSATVILTRRRLMSEADSMLISEMDGMKISDIDNITLG